MPKKDEARKIEQQEELFTVEELARRHGVPPWTLDGMMVAYKWGQGKRITEREFLKAKANFLSGPMVRKW